MGIRFPVFDDDGNFSNFVRDALAKVFTLKSDFTPIKDAANNLVELVTNGRLSLSTMDADYVRIIKNQHAIFIGSSNSADGYGWTRDLSTRRGWIHHNYAVGGGAFVPVDGADNFRAQARRAIADTAVPKNLVRWIFVTDMSNDIRGINNVESAANSVFSELRTNFPNARIIVIPVVWTYVENNWNALDKRVGVRRRYAEVRRAGYPYGVEVIRGSWLWFWDKASADGMLEGVYPNFHLNNTGYAKLVRNIEGYLDGKDYKPTIDWEVANAVIDDKIAASLINVSRDAEGIVTINALITTYTEVAVDQVIATLPIGTAPVRQMVVEITDGTRNRKALYIQEDASNRQITAMTALPGAGTYWFQTSYATL